jgi:hypothetical protein
LCTKVLQSTSFRTRILPSTPISSKCSPSIQVFPTKTMYKFLLSLMRATCPAY